MRVRAISLDDISGADEAAWRELASAALEPNPFFEMEALLPLRERAGGSRLSLLVAEDGGGLTAGMPLRHEPRWRGLPRPVLTTLPRTGLESAYQLGTPLLARDGGGAGLEALLGGLARESALRSAGILVIDFLGADGPVSGHLRDAAARLKLPLRILQSWDRAATARGDKQDWMATLGRERSRQLRKRRRRLGEALDGDVELVERAGDADAVEEFLRLEASGWKGSTGSALGRDEETAAGFRLMCERFAAAGRLHLLSLEVGGRSTAMQCCLRSGDGAFFVRVGHDVSLQRHGPGIQVQVAAMDHFRQRDDVSWLDSCSPPDNDLMLELFPDRRRMATALVGVGGRVDRALVTSLPPARRLAVRVRDRLRRSDGAR